jgi:hypothetical protein
VLIAAAGLVIVVSGIVALAVGRAPRLDDAGRDGAHGNVAAGTRRGPPRHATEY